MELACDGICMMQWCKCVYKQEDVNRSQVLAGIWMSGTLGKQNHR
jgi:hypothetical protein